MGVAALRGRGSGIVIQNRPGQKVGSFMGPPARCRLAGLAAGFLTFSNCSESNQISSIGFPSLSSVGWSVYRTQPLSHWVFAVMTPSNPS